MSRLLERRLDGRPLNPSQRRELRSHLSTCQACADLYDRRVRKLRVLAGTPGEATGLERRLLFAEILKLYDPPVAVSRNRLVPVTAAAVLVLVLAIGGAFVWRHVNKDTSPVQEYYGIRGAEEKLPAVGLGVSGVDAKGDEYEVLAGRGVAMNDALRFYLTVREPHLRHLLLFAVQESSDLTWYFPASAGEQGLEIPEEPRLWKLPDEIVMRGTHRAGPLRLVAVLSAGPLPPAIMESAWRWAQEDPEELERSLGGSVRVLSVDLKVLEGGRSSP